MIHQVHYVDNTALVEISVLSLCVCMCLYSLAPPLMSLAQRRLMSQAATQVAVSVSKGCPFVSSQLNVVKASEEVQEDVFRNASKNTGIALTDHSHIYNTNVDNLANISTTDSFVSSM